MSIETVGEPNDSSVPTLGGTKNSISVGAPIDSLPAIDVGNRKARTVSV